MKRVERSHEPDLPTVSLYRQDLDEIVAILQGSAPVSIVHGDFALDSLDELKREFGDVVDKLKLETRGVSLEIAPKYVSMGGRSSDSGQRIERILLSRKRRLGGVWQLVSGLVSVVGVILFLVVVIITAVLGISLIALIVVLPATLLLSLTGLFVPPKCRVFLVRRHEHQTFWGRHTGDFIKAGIALGGTVLGYAIRVLQEYYGRQPLP